MIPRYAQITAPIRSTVVRRSCSSGGSPAAFEMKTIERVFAIVQTKKASSHIAYRLTRYQFRSTTPSRPISS
jgi:hypothetical protein